MIGCVRSKREIAVGHPHRALPLCRHGRQHLTCLGVARSYHYGHAGFDDAALFARDRGDRVAKPIHVVKADRGYHADQRRHHVGRVQAPAKPGLDNREIDRGLGEIQEHQRDRELEKREREIRALVNRTQPLDILQHQPRRHLGAVDPGALGQMNQVGLGVEAAAYSSRAHDRVEHRGHRPLALGSGDMDRAQPPMRVADKLERLVHAFELVNLAPRLRANRASPAFSRGVA